MQKHHTSKGERKTLASRFKDEKGGLVVDYLGIGTDLKHALSFYADAFRFDELCL